MRPRILVVDDELDVLLLCRVNLEFEGYDVMEARDGRSGLARARDETPDLVLLDVMMTDMDGWKVLAELKADPATAAIPVIMLTARVLERDQIQALSGGACDYVTKPFNPITLSRAVKEALHPSAPDGRERRRRQMLERLRLFQGA